LSEHRKFPDRLQEQGIDRAPQMHLGLAAVEMEARRIDTDRAGLAREIEVINAVLAEVETQAAPPAAAITLASGRNLVRRPARRRGGLLAAFRAAPRSVWGRIQSAARPVPSWRRSRPRHAAG
jgi:hypothetical protein